MKKPETVWLFDLDDTLHDASSHIFPHINGAMTRYLMTHLDLSEESAGRLRSEYWLRYGATLKGLMRHHGTNPHHFLHHTHQFQQLEEMVIKTGGLRSVLTKLAGRKIVFTNAPMNYAIQILKLLHIRHLFDGIFSIESSRFQPKPSTTGFVRLARRFKLDIHRCTMVEDNLPTLKTAKRLGMKTVFVHPRAQRPSYVDVHVHSVLALPKVAATI